MIDNYILCPFIKRSPAQLPGASRTMILFLGVSPERIVAA
jgi:hypothetical protein